MRKGFVYFIQAGVGGPIKVGYADDVEKRIIYLQCGNHLDLTVRAVVAGPARLERQIHRELERMRLRMRGEWFRLTAILEGVIERVNAAQLDASNIVQWLEVIREDTEAKTKEARRQAQINFIRAKATDPYVAPDLREYYADLLSKAEAEMQEMVVES